MKKAGLFTCVLFENSFLIHFYIISPHHPVFHVLFSEKPKMRVGGGRESLTGTEPNLHMRDILTVVNVRNTF